MKMTDLADYKKADFCIYKYLITKLIYLPYNMSPYITFIVGQCNMLNADLRMGYL